MRSEQWHRRTVGSVVADEDARLRDQLVDVIRHRLDVVDAVVDEERLPVAVQLPDDAGADQLAVPAADASLDGQPVVRRRLQIGDVSYAQQRHV